MEIVRSDYQQTVIFLGLLFELSILNWSSVIDIEDQITDEIISNEMDQEDEEWLEDDL